MAGASAGNSKFRSGSVPKSKVLVQNKTRRRSSNLSTNLLLLVSFWRTGRKGEFVHAGIRRHEICQIAIMPDYQKKESKKERRAARYSRAPYLLS